MGDGFTGDAAGAWATYLRQMTDRPGWSVARLARESGIHRATIFDWIKGGTGERLTVAFIVAIANALDDHPVNTFIAAANLVEEEPQDYEIGLILKSELSDEEKQQQIRVVEARRERDMQNRIHDTQQILRDLGRRAS
jgi:transcriptional regulator with XRE-family HTH domain